MELNVGDKYYWSGTPGKMRVILSKHQLENGEWLYDIRRLYDEYEVIKGQNLDSKALVLCKETVWMREINEIINEST